MSDATNKAVFISYASQDAAAAKRICEAMQGAGLEVWFDQSELRGGDSWDQKIRKQIKECALFVPVISANTQARPEGYFRLEWKLAVDWSHLMADDQAFIVPVVIDDTPQGAARVPEKFQEVQWTRLVLTETPAAFAGRVRTLLSGESAPASDQRAAARVAGGAGPKKAPASIWWTRVVPLAGVAMALAFAFRFMWSLSRPAHSSPTKAETPAAATKTAPLSEARQLIARARAMTTDKFDSTADDFAAAEELIKRALKTDPTDAEVWTASALFNGQMGTRGFDHSDARRESARSHAERALSLDPNSIEGLYALGRWQRDHEPDAAVAEATFKKVLAKAPDHQGALVTLATHYMRRDRFDEALPLFERALVVPTGKPLVLYGMFLGYFSRSRFVEAERCIRESIAIQPSVNTQGGLAMLLLSWKGDAQAAAEALVSGPAAARNEHRIIWITAYTHLVRRAPEDVLTTLRRFPDDFIQDNWFVGPKGYWEGRAHAQAGRPEAARVAWEAGLDVVRARLAKAPNSWDLRLAQAELLALLGREQEALKEAKVVEELQRGMNRVLWTETPARVYAALGRVTETLKFLRTPDVVATNTGADSVGWPLTSALLRIDPLWDKVRDDPAFQKRIASTATAESARATHGAVSK